MESQKFQSWSIELNFKSCDGESAPHETAIRLTGEYTEGDRPVNECIAIDLSFLMEMLLASGKTIRASTMKETIEAFAAGN